MIRAEHQEALLRCQVCDFEADWLSDFAGHEDPFTGEPCPGGRDDA